jgi:hypothetical protein
MAEKQLIPLYDASAPIACTISNAEIPERVDLIERMRTALLRIERASTGLLLHFPRDDAVRADLRTFAVDEKRCCQFWGFDVLESADGLALRWDGPPAVNDLLATLHTFFTSDAPISTLEGLL